MTDKELKAKIIAEIERMQSRLNLDSPLGIGAHTNLGVLKDFINSLPEEPVSEDLEEAIEDAMPDANWYIEENNDTTGEDAYNSIQMGNMFKAGANLQKAKDESTTEDLGEYINELSKQFPEVSFAKLSRIAVRVANWQKEQDKQWLAEEHKNIFAKGRDSMKQQMMKDTVRGYVKYDDTRDENPYVRSESFYWDSPYRYLCQSDEIELIIIRK